MIEYNGVYIYIPSIDEIVYIKEGSGSDFDEDIENGFVDYIYYDICNMDNDFAENSGMMLLTEMFRDKYKNTAECIPDVLDFHYCNRNLPYVILNEDLLNKKGD